MTRAVLLPLVLLGACAVGPNYTASPPPVPPRFAEAAPPGDAADPAEWWKRFADPELDRLVVLALRGNLGLATARSRIEGARAQQRAAGSAFGPTLDAQAGVNRIDFSKNAGLSSLASQFGGGGGGGPSTPGQGIALPGSGITTWSVGLDASWELDLFGGVARQVEAARARTEAAEWNARDLRVSIVAEVASDYLRLRALQSRIAIARQEIERQQATGRLVAARRNAGLIAELPQRQQAVQLANASATLPGLEAQAKAQVHALGVLTGAEPNALAGELTPAVAPPKPPPLLPVGLPSDLLRRRPDIRAAERQLAAATADIGAAEADLYPRFNLMGMAELISTSLATLFERDSLQTTVNGAVSLPIFDGGRRRATVAQRRASADEALNSYKKVVLVAVQDVEDGLADYAAEQRRNAELRRGTEAAERGLVLARASYTAGLVDFNAVLDAQGALLAGRDTLAQSDAAVLTDLARVYKALGGGWSGEPAR